MWGVSVRRVGVRRVDVGGVCKKGGCEKSELSMGGSLYTFKLVKLLNFDLMLQIYCRFCYTVQYKPSRLGYM